MKHEFLKELGLEDINPGACGESFFEPGGEVITSYDPATGEAIASVKQANRDDYERVVAEATINDGNAGAVRVNVQDLRVQNDGEISTSTQFGEAGSVVITADTVSLNQGGRINAETDGGQGGTVGLTPCFVSFDLPENLIRQTESAQILRHAFGNIACKLNHDLAARLP